MSSIFKKAAIAVAVSVFCSGAANADVAYDFEAGSETVVLASEIFGDDPAEHGADETLIVMQNTELDLDDTAAGILGAGDDMDVGTFATVKFTVGGQGVFAEDLSTTAAVNAANGGAGAFTCSAGPTGAAVADTVVDANCGGAALVTWVVTQGGAIGDNTITFELTEATGAAATVGGVTFGNVAIKNLTSALGDQGNAGHRGMVQMGVEYVEGVDAGATDGITTTATDTPLIILGSQPGLALTCAPTDYNTTPFQRINVGNAELTFTGGTVDGRSDFDPAADLGFTELGTLQLQRQAIDTVSFPGAFAGIVKKENGDDFDFQGGDSHAMVVTAGAGSFQTSVGTFLYLDAPASACSVGVPPNLPNITGESETITSPGAVNFVLTGSTTELTAVHDLCYSVNGTSNIPEVSTIGATWTVNFFNTRYDDQAVSCGDFGPLLRNGCIASFFNVPPSDNANDTAFIRLSNTSTTNTGDIRGTLYAQDGTALGTDVTIAPALAPHATQVFTSMASDVVTAAGQTLISIENAFGIAPGDYLGRGRLVLKGAFDTCEGLGLIRNASTGALYNMTSTTQGNEAASPNDGNNGN